MLLKNSEDIINRFVREVRSFWQALFAGSVLIYAVSFFHHFTVRAFPRPLSYFRTIDLISFLMAITLAVLVFHYKRQYFSLRAIRIFLERLHKQNPELEEKELTRVLMNSLKSRMKMVWLFGAGLVLLGVVFYWWTFTTRNMHVYFVVGLYSLVMNYPRRDIFLDVPYLIHEICKSGQQKEED